MNNLVCPICYQKGHIGLGKGCKMCGMILEDEAKDFCCQKCRKQYTNSGVSQDR